MSNYNKLTGGLALTKVTALLLAAVLLLTGCGNQVDSSAITKTTPDSKTEQPGSEAFGTGDGDGDGDSGNTNEDTDMKLAAGGNAYNTTTDIGADTDNSAAGDPESTDAADPAIEGQVSDTETATENQTDATQNIQDDATTAEVKTGDTGTTEPYAYLAQAAERKFLEEYPIMNIIPINYAKYSDDFSEYREFSVDSRVLPEDGTFVLIITDRTGDNEQFAKDYIRSQGYNPDDYEFIYNYTPINNL